MCLPIVSAQVLQYRITDAVPYDPLVHDKMVSDPNLFVRWHHAPNNNGSICTVPAEHETQGFNCSWPIRAGAYDWSQAEIRDWYLDNIIKPTLRVGDGAWIDGDGKWKLLIRERLQTDVAGVNRSRRDRLYGEKRGTST